MMNCAPAPLVSIFKLFPWASDLIVMGSALPLFDCKSVFMLCRKGKLISLGRPMIKYKCELVDT